MGRHSLLKPGGRVSDSKARLYKALKIARRAGPDTAEDRYSDSGLRTAGMLFPGRAIQLSRNMPLRSWQLFRDRNREQISHTAGGYRHGGQWTLLAAALAIHTQKGCRAPQGWGIHPPHQRVCSQQLQRRMASRVYQQRNEYANHSPPTRGNVIQLPRDEAHVHTTGMTHEGC